MELLAPLCMLAVIGGLAGGALSWSLYFQPRWDGARWSKLASQLGLTLGPSTAAPPLLNLYRGPTTAQPLVGERGGMPVRVVMYYVVRGGKNRRRVYFTYVEVALPRSLGLGMSVKPTNWMGTALLGLIGARDLEVGIPALDERYEIGATVPYDAQALLGTPYVAEALVALHAGIFRPSLSDTVVHLEGQQKCFDPETIALALDRALDLAQRVVAARGALGASPLDRVLTEVWRPVGEARGLVLDLHTKTLSGRAEGVHVEVLAMQSGNTLTTAFIARFDRRLGVGLRLEREGALTKLGAVFGMQDIEVGDPNFDRRFIVKGNPVDEVRALLTPDVRERLIHLQEQASSLTVADDHLRAEVAWLITEGAWIDLGIQAVARAAAALTQVNRGGAGPFRMI